MIRCIAIDDEPLALQQLVRYVGRVPDVEMLGAFYSVEEATDFISRHDIDVIFLDVEMPDCNGVDFAKSLGDNGPYVVFTTAYPQYAVDGFRLDAVDYLLKPLSFEELTQALAKLQRRLNAVYPNTEAEITVKESGMVRRIKVKDILYIKGLGEYVSIVLAGESRAVVTFERLKRLERQLAQYSFMRVHKSYLINLNAVESAAPSGVIIRGETIPVGETYRSAFARYLKTKL